MIRNVGHPQSKVWRYTHVLRHRRSWFIMTVVVAIAGVLFLSGYFNGVPWPALLDAVLRTTYRLAIAYAVALALGVALGLFVGWSPFTDALFPVFDILQNIPSFALLPFFIYFFGFTDQMIILFAMSSIIWPILFAVLTAIKNAHRDLDDAATVFGAVGLRRIPSYLAPLSFPAILTGSIVGIAIGWEAVIGAEIIAHVGGFGGFAISADSTGVSRMAIAGMLAILIIVFVVNRLVWTPLLHDSAKRYSL